MTKKKTEKSGAKKQIVPIVFAANENYAPYAAVCIQSIKENADRENEYEIYVFHTGLTKETVKKIESMRSIGFNVRCVDVSRYIAEVKSKFYTHSYFSDEMYFRILIPDVLPRYKKVLYIDCDTVVTADISELYETDIGNCVIGGCRNPMHAKMDGYVRERLRLDSAEYINSGVLLFNCEEFKKQKIKDKIFGIIGDYGVLDYPDQDLINIACVGKIFYIDLSWNYLYHIERLNRTDNSVLHLIPRDENLYKPVQNSVKIMHYTGDRKPWRHNAAPYADLFWKYAEKSVFYGEIKKRFMKENGGLQTVKLIFATFYSKELHLICAYETTDEGNKDTVLYFLNNDLYRPVIFLKREIARDEVKLIQKQFTVKIPYGTINKAGANLFFTVNDKGVLFRYDKFFPLNGCPSSYFYHNGYLMYRNGRNLIIKKSGIAERALRELKYERKLRRTPFRKFVFIRLAYFLLRKSVPHNIWLLSDRPDCAGDNGEALFKYLRRKKTKSINPFFVINKDSEDYKRLRRYGHVVGTSTFKHKFLALFCKGKAVSQTDFVLYTVFERNYIKDLLFNENKVFLQHGITKDDVSDLYSRYNQDFNLFITACEREYESIISNKNYGMGKSVVKLTGFPRHDALSDCREKIVIINPTWRLNLSGVSEEEFAESDYFSKWNGFLNDKNFLSALRKYRYKALFVVHNKMKPFSKLFSLPNKVSIVDGSVDFSEIFSKGALFITDYSSNAFEFAYLRKPVVYFQFDFESFFGGHTYKKGYFDYDSDGFGEVATDVARLSDIVKSYLSSDCELKQIYNKRINSFLKYNDDKNCERVTEEIEKLGR